MNYFLITYFDQSFSQPIINITSSSKPCYKHRDHQITVLLFLQFHVRSFSILIQWWQVSLIFFFFQKYFNLLLVEKVFEYGFWASRYSFSAVSSLIVTLCYKERFLIILSSSSSGPIECQILNESIEGLYKVQETGEYVVPWNYFIFQPKCSYRIITPFKFRS